MSKARDVLGVLVWLLAAAATMANSGAPPLRAVVKVVGQDVGTVTFALDQRFYEDKPLEVTLAAGTYRELVFLSVPVTYDASAIEPPRLSLPTPVSSETLRALPGAVVLLRLQQGDPRLVGAPGRIELQVSEATAESSAEREEDQPGTKRTRSLVLYAETIEGSFGLIEFRREDVR